MMLCWISDRKENRKLFKNVIYNYSYTSNFKNDSIFIISCTILYVVNNIIYFALLSDSANSGFIYKYDAFITLIFWIVRMIIYFPIRHQKKKSQRGGPCYPYIVKLLAEEFTKIKKTHNSIVKRCIYIIVDLKIGFWQWSVR